MRRNKKRNRLNHGTSMQQVSNNYYNCSEDMSEKQVQENSFYITLLNNVQDYFDKVIAGQRLYQLQQITQQQDYFETQLEQQKSNWEDFISRFAVINSPSNITEIS
jgi:hypothetical protein